MALIIDTSTGTMLTAETCRIVPDDAFTESEWDGMEDRSDSEIAAFGRERGRPILPDAQALDAIARLMSGNEWDTETIEAVADLVTETGRTIADLNTP